MLGAATRLERYFLYLSDDGDTCLREGARAIHLACPNDALAAFEADQWRLGRYAELWCAERLVCTFAPNAPPASPALAGRLATRRPLPLARLKALRSEIGAQPAERRRRRA